MKFKVLIKDRSLTYFIIYNFISNNIACGFNSVYPAAERKLELIANYHVKRCTVKMFKIHFNNCNKNFYRSITTVVRLF